MNDPRGSVWRRWDLHFHTPSSFDYRDKSVTDEMIAETLRANEIGVVVVTDHHKIDCGRIRNLRKLANDKFTVLPGIELRTELGGSSKVHIIGIFSESSDLDDLWTKISGQLPISPADVAREGDENVWVRFEDAAEVIHELDGLTSVHAGSKSNSIEKLQNVEKLNRIIKRDLTRKYVDIFEIGKLDDAASYEQKVFPSIGKWIPLIIGSDNHDAKSYELNYPCWIKSDRTFEGLRQVVNEPRDRVFLGDMPPKLKLVNEKKTQFLENIVIRKHDNSNLEENWFDTKLVLNHDMIAIIGNKGSGKSALADILGHLGNTKNHGYFSFLNKYRFRKPKSNPAQHFAGHLTWISGYTVEKQLDDEPLAGTLEGVSLIPQNYLEDICNTVGTSEKSDFDLELEEVIFSHIEFSRRLGCDSLNALVAHTTEETRREIDILKSDLTSLNEAIVRFEDKLNPAYKKKLVDRLDLRNTDCKVLDESKPLQIPKPGENPTLKETLGPKLKVIEQKQTQLTDTEERIKFAEEELDRFTRQLSAVTKLQEKVKNIQMQYERFVQDCEHELSLIGMQVSDLVSFNVISRPLESKLGEIRSGIARVTPLLSLEDREESLRIKKRKLEKDIGDLNLELDAPNKAYQGYLIELADWNKKRQLIVGDSDTPDTIEFLRNELAGIGEIPSKLKNLYARRVDNTRAIHAAKQKLVDTYAKIYGPVQEFIDNHPLVQRKLELHFDVRITDIGFESGFLTFLNQRKVGSFCGSDDASRRVQDLMSLYDFNDEKDVIEFTENIVGALKKDKRSEEERSVEIESQLRQNATVVDIYNYIFSLDYFEPRYVLQLGKKNLDQLSPGEKGTLLVIFYLLIDKRKNPLIIDQPEGNLDSETVVDLLVPCIKEAKKERQIILVTHNPNLAVVCDAEQIIYAAIDKEDGNRITYQSGAIENPDINKRLSDVLEGTMNAFRRRDVKYQEVPTTSSSE